MSWTKLLFVRRSGLVGALIAFSPVVASGQTVPQLAPNAPTDYFWVAVWIVPASYPSGTFTYKAVATDMGGHS